jgi:hypothetical protein
MRNDFTVTVRVPRWLLIAMIATWIVPMVSLVDRSLSAKGLPTAERGQRLRERPASAPFGFADVTQKEGLLTELTPTWGSAWVDRDLDGRAEVLIGRHKRAAQLLSSAPEGFIELPYGDLLERPPGRTYYDRHNCSWGEADGDGSADLVCVSGAQKGMGTGHNQLLVGPDLDNVAGRAGIVDPRGRGRTANWLDYDSDGDLDLFIGNEFRSGSPNRLYRNDGGEFTAVDSPVASEFATADSSWADVDRDGDADLLVVGHGQIGTRFYRNDDGSFVEASLDGISGLEWSSSSWGDFDGDGWIDLHLVADDRAIVFRNARGRLVAKDEVELTVGRTSAWLDVDNDGDLDLFVVQGALKSGSLDELNEPDLLLVFRGGRFRPVAAEGAEGPEVGSGDSVSVADFDRDGRQDVLVTNGFLDTRGQLTLLRNISRVGNHAALMIRGEDRNPFAFGARFRVLTSQGSYWRFITDGMSFHTQAEAGYAHLGLGRAEKARVRFLWPDGTVDCYSIEAGERLTIEPGASTC